MGKWCKLAAPWLQIIMAAVVFCELRNRSSSFIGTNNEGVAIVASARRVVGTFPADVAEALSTLMAVEEAL